MLIKMQVRLCVCKCSLFKVSNEIMLFSWIYKIGTWEKLHSSDSFRHQQSWKRIHPVEIKTSQAKCWKLQAHFKETVTKTRREVNQVEHSWALSALADNLKPQMETAGLTTVIHSIFSYIHLLQTWLCMCVHIKTVGSLWFPHTPIKKVIKCEIKIYKEYN